MGTKQTKSFLPRVRVSVPASSANLGPGYDVLGVALNLFNDVEISYKKPKGNSDFLLRVDVEGEGADFLPRNEKNLIWQSAKKVLDLAGLRRKGHFHLKVHNRIPLARGLGSSAAARLSGALAANALANDFLSQQSLLDLTAGLEGHPDNVVPSLVGGLTASAFVGGEVQFVRLRPPRDLRAVICVPGFELSTRSARKVLPKRVAHADAVFNVSRVSLLVAALCARNYDRLKTAMEDRLHQNYRKKLVPGLERVIQNGYRAGALGVALSGAGPSVIAFTDSSRAGKVGEAMRRGFLSAGPAAQILILDFNLKGALVRC
ncbi:MAG: homoserine kinase [Elusimicrobia bacterium]|nr:homoserine kinase [Elusimicrobiota bacterium]